MKVMEKLAAKPEETEKMKMYLKQKTKMSVDGETMLF